MAVDIHRRDDATAVFEPIQQLRAHEYVAEQPGLHAPRHRVRRSDRVRARPARHLDALHERRLRRRSRRCGRRKLVRTVLLYARRPARPPTTPSSSSSRSRGGVGDGVACELPREDRVWAGRFERSCASLLLGRWDQRIRTRRRRTRATTSRRRSEPPSRASSSNPAASLMLNPTINSYKRLIPGWFAPVNVSWGHESRSCAVSAIRGEASRALADRAPAARGRCQPVRRARCFDDRRSTRDRERLGPEPAPRMSRGARCSRPRPSSAGRIERSRRAPARGHAWRRARLAARQRAREVITTH